MGFQSLKLKAGNRLFITYNYSDIGISQITASSQYQLGYSYLCVA